MQIAYAIISVESIKMIAQNDLIHVSTVSEFTVLTINFDSYQNTKSVFFVPFVLEFIVKACDETLLVVKQNLFFVTQLLTVKIK